MDNYIIRYATKDDISLIQEFIDNNWKKSHILVKDRDLFEWQYTSDKLDYVLGIDSDGKIQGMLGFISYDDSENRDIATSMWKANEGCGFLGIKLLMYVMENEPHRTLFSPGINVVTSGGIYRRMGIEIGKMSQWYRLRDKNDYIIAKIVDSTIPSYECAKDSKFAEYMSFEDFKRDFDFDKYVSPESVPYKSLMYVRRRYFCHPSYRYKIYGVKDEYNETKAVIVLRVQKCNGARVVRFVDCIGDVEQIGNITAELDRILEEEDAEYIDMYEAGVSENLLKNAGWTNLQDTQNIIPNYFSPYEQKNVEVNYCTTDKNIVLFRGDGDQDRPN